MTLARELEQLVERLAVRGTCPFRDGEDYLCGRPLEDASTDDDTLGVWRCELGHTVQEVEGTDTMEQGLYADQKPQLSDSTAQEDE